MLYRKDNWIREKYDEVFYKFINTYPELFSRDNPKPLKRGIREDIINDHKIDLSDEK